MAAAGAVVAAVGVLGNWDRGGGRSASPEPGSPTIVSVPASLPADCSRPVDQEINGVIRDAPPNSIVAFPGGGCYGHDGSLVVTDKAGLTIDGNGATFKAVTPGDTCRANWRITGGRNITLRNMTVHGVNDRGFDADRWPDYRSQCQHGYSFDSVQGGKLLDSRSVDTVGDALAVGPDLRPRDFCVVPPSRDILVDRFHGSNSGRTVSITHGDGVTIQNSYFGDIYDNAIDLETDDDCMSSRNVRILNNRFGRYHYAMIAYTGAEKGGRGGGLEVTGNVAEAEPVSCYPAVYIKPGTDEIRRNNFVIRDNQLKTSSDGIAISQAVHVRIEGNTVAKNSGGCGIDSTAVVRVERSDHVNVYDNRGVGGAGGGFGRDLAVDAASTNVTQLPREGLGPFPPLPEPDDAPPTVAITAPADGSKVSGTVAIKTTASGDNLRRAEFRIDDEVVKTDNGPSYDYMWDTTTADKRPHTVTVTLYNSFGESASTTITVSVE